MTQGTSTPERPTRATTSATPPTRPPATFVLVPGAGGQAWYWHRVVDELRSRGHAAVPVDLPAADDRAGLHEYVDTILAAVGDRRRVVLVAQSMGGFSAPLVCERVPVDLLVLVNAMIPQPGESGGAWWGDTGQARARAEHAEREGRAVTDEIDPMVEFLHDLPDDVVAEAVRQGEPPQSSTPFATPFPLDRWPDVPTRVVVGRDDRFFPAGFQRRVAEARLGITPDELPGGHLVALARPRELADQLERYWVELS